MLKFFKSVLTRKRSFPNVSDHNENKKIKLTTEEPLNTR